VDEIEKIAVSGLLRYLRRNRCIVHSSYTAVFPSKGHGLQLPLVQTGTLQRVFSKPQIFSHAHDEPKRVTVKFRLREPSLCECIYDSTDAGAIPLDKPCEVEYLCYERVSQERVVLSLEHLDHDPLRQRAFSLMPPSSPAGAIRCRRTRNH